MPLEIRGLTPLIQVFDMPTSLHFYRDLLGFEVTSTSPGEGDDVDWVMLNLCGFALMLNTAYEKHDRPASPDTSRIDAHGDTTIYFACPDVDRTYAHCRDNGIKVSPPTITGYGFKALSLLDPDGYSLCFHWPADDE